MPDRPPPSHPPRAARGLRKGRASRRPRAPRLSPRRRELARPSAKFETRVTWFASSGFAAPSRKMTTNRWPSGETSHPLVIRLPMSYDSSRKSASSFPKTGAPPSAVTRVATIDPSWRRKYRFPSRAQRGFDAIWSETCHCASPPAALRRKTCPRPPSVESYASQRPSGEKTPPPSFAGPRHDDRGLSVGLAVPQTDHPEVELGRGCRHLEGEHPPVRREARHAEGPRQLEEETRRPRPVGALQVDAPDRRGRASGARHEPEGAVGRVGDVAAVGAPRDRLVVALERELRECVAGDVVDPDVALRPAADHDGGAISVGCETRPGEAARRGRLLHDRPLPVDDGEPVDRLVLARPVRAESRRGHVDLRAAVGGRLPSGRRHDLLEDRHGPPRRDEPARVEGHRVDRPLPREQDVAGRSPARERASLVDDGPLPRRELDGLDDSLVVVASGELRREQDRLAAGEGRGPPMRALARGDVRLRQGTRLAAGRRDHREAAGRLRGEHDRVVRHPGGAARERRVADRGRRPSRDGRLAELAAGEEADPLSVRREEGAQGAVGLRHLRRDETIQPPQVEAGAARRGVTYASWLPSGDTTAAAPPPSIRSSDERRIWPWIADARFGARARSARTPDTTAAAANAAASAQGRRARTSCSLSPRSSRRCDLQWGWATRSFLRRVIGRWSC